MLGAEKGSLVRIKAGCGDEGKIGVLLERDPEDLNFFSWILLDGARTMVNNYWLEVINDSQ
jgi:hypothetical protein